MTETKASTVLRAHRRRHRTRGRQSRSCTYFTSLPVPLVVLLLLIGTAAATAAAAAGGSSATTTNFKGKTSSVKYALDKSGGSTKGSDEERHWSRRALDAVLSSINSEDDAETTASRTVFDVVRGRARVSSGDSLVDSSSGKEAGGSRRNKRKEARRAVPAAATADEAPSSMFGWRRREADPSDVSRAKPKAVPVDDSEKTYFERIGRRIAERIERTKDVVCKPAF